MDLGLDAATVVVAGGTTGMGRSAAECFAADGARVAVLARSAPDLDSTAIALTGLGSPEAIGVRADLLDFASVDSAFAQIGERWGHINAVVNAAGPLTAPLKRFEEYSDAEWLEVFSGLTLGPVRTIRAALPYLRKAHLSDSSETPSKRPENGQLGTPGVCSATDPMAFHASTWRTVPGTGVLSRQRTANGRSKGPTAASGDQAPDLHIPGSGGGI
jgi:NAD(P)-dependent dehydrogenase (short-subunit alcohol dehydrogenase family)